MSPAALELLVVASDGVRVTPLPARGQVMLGRGDECEVRIENRSVSRRHAVIHVGEVLRIEDLGSANGTFVRDLRSASDTTGAQPLRKLSRESIQITVGERVNLGSVPIVVRWAVGARRDPATSAPVVVRDPAMRALYEQVARAARSTISVLFLGEAGVGKEVLAREIHERSPRAAGPYVELDCAAVPPSQLEGELFGHEQNAFTGASQGRPGLLERADGGTIFLDEVAELPLPVQVKLLRVLEDGKVLRVGGRAPRQLDLRFVAASHRDLAAEAARGPFRQDLYFRLNGVSFVVPPLRERVSEIAPLAEQFLTAATRGLGRPPLRFSMEALRALESYAWPGNVRELHNVIERAAILADGDVILPADLPGRLTGAATGPVRRLDARTTTGPVRRVEARTGPVTAEIRPLVPGASADRQRIVEALEQCGGNQTRAAKLLGLSLRTLAHRIAEYNVPLPRKR